MEIDVDSLKFHFPSEYHLIKYDECLSFKKLSSAFQMKCECFQCPSHNCAKEACPNFSECSQQHSNSGLKGVDVLACNDTTLFLIESKDYSKEPNPPIEHIVMEVAKKFRDTLFGIWCGCFCEEDPSTQVFFDRVRKSQLALRFIFHFEPPEATKHKSGFHRNSTIFSPLTMQAKLQQKLIPMREFIRVANMENPGDWQVTRK